MDTWHDGDMLTNPNIVAHNGIAFQRQFIFHWSNCAAPVAADNVKRISRHPVHPVIGAIHHKLHPFGNGTELAYNQPIANEVVEMGDVFLKLVSTIHIIVIGIVADDDARVLHHVFDEAEAWDVGIRESLVGVRTLFYHIYRIYRADYH